MNLEIDIVWIAPDLDKLFCTDFNGLLLLVNFETVAIEGRVEVFDPYIFF